MKTRTYNTELDKKSFFTKLEKYFKFNFFGALLQGRIKDGRSELLYGFRGFKKFAINFVDKYQIHVSAHICFFDIICLCAAIIMLVGAGIMFSNYGVITGFIFLLFPLFFGGLSVLIYYLSWSKINKVLKKDFSCTRIK